MVLKVILSREVVKKMLDKIKDLVSGKKTYILMVISIIGTIVAWSQGAIDTVKAVELIIAAITGVTLRAGVTKSGIPPAE